MGEVCAVCHATLNHEVLEILVLREGMLSREQSTSFIELLVMFVTQSLQLSFFTRLVGEMF